MRRVQKETTSFAEMPVSKFFKIVRGDLTIFINLDHISRVVAAHREATIFVGDRMQPDVTLTGPEADQFVAVFQQEVQPTDVATVAAGLASSHHGR
jgi:hypothetical protein